MKVLLDHNPLAPSNGAPIDFGATLRTRPAWITAQQTSSQSQFQSLTQPTSQALPAVTAYHLQFELPEAAVIRVHVSADERYLLYLDGQVVGRGPERGSVVLPEGLHGTFRDGGKTIQMRPGTQAVDL